MKRLSISCILIYLSVISYAQVDSVQKAHSIKATFIGLSYAFEQPLTQKSVINLELMITGGFGSYFIGGDYWLIVPIFRFEPRYYYNYLKRGAKGKKIINNSASFFSLPIDYMPGLGIGKNA